ncbi:MAG TPA: TIGR04283 family arsenosugar biosynthesis glycosyltransferase [Gaiellales bacterium]
MRFSVVIPTLDEAATVAGAVAAARAALTDPEVIVADAGSGDGTAEAAVAAGARVLLARGVRAEAMNAGAAAASGDVLVFLHADTHLPAGAGAAIATALAGAGAGAFRIAFDRPRPLVERVVNARSRLLKIVYGDQALFVSRAAFERVGGYRPLPIMEDRDLATRLRRSVGLVIVPLAVTTSARRHRRDGHARALARNWLIQLLYTLRVPPERLARMYPPAR